jgi:hypothetical protein
MILDASGNIYVTGSSIEGLGGFDFCTIKYTSSGLISWLQIYNGPGNGDDRSKNIVLDNSGNVYISGTSRGSGTEDDFCTIKYNSSGVQQWVRRYNGPASFSDNAMCMVIDIAGNVYISGYSIGIGTSSDYCTIKYNSSGVQQWVQRYNGPGNDDDNVYSMDIDISGNIYVTGTTYSSSSSSDFCTIKYNPSGVQQWVKIYNGTANGTDRPNSITVDDSDNVYVTGCSGGNTSTLDYCTIKYNSSGTQQWVKKYNGPGNDADEAYSAAVDVSGNVYVTGSSSGIGTGQDYCTVKYNASGVQQWVVRYNGPGNNFDSPCSIIVNNSGNVYITGESRGNGTGNDYCTLKYYEPIGIQKISSEVPTAFSLHQNYPNPFNPSTKIRFALPSASFVNLSIYDLLGREIVTLVSEGLQPGTYEVEWDASNYMSNVYFYRISARYYVDTKKMILIK